jgi:alkylation response protein AidB-like acyl-CoA dehydrogenase
LSTAEFTGIPLPGRGRTLTRWRALSEVAAHDLSLAQLFEAHTNAIAIHAELDGFAPPLRGIWGVWTAVAPRAHVVIDQAGGETGDDVTVSGRKAWCSGAGIVTHALVTALDRKGRSRLVAMSLAQPGVLITLEGWDGFGMRAARGVDVVFDRAVAVAIGEPDGYHMRPGFWHQRAGIAACWYGAAAKLGESLRNDVARQHEPHAAAHLGLLDVALAQAKALLREAAEAIDRDPASSARTQVLEVRAAAEFAADAALAHAGRVLGIELYSRNGSLARLAADLPVFLRQSRAERDLEYLGGTIAQDREARWDL